MENEKDPILWTVARKRAMFKKHLYTYAGVNVFLWILWYVTNRNEAGFMSDGMIPWPVWVTLGWGLGLFFNYRDAYGAPDHSAEKEYEKLKKEKEGQSGL
jgi:hypothetical protein